MAGEDKVYDLIMDKMINYPGAKIGITDILYSDYSHKYKCALVIAVPHREIISINNYKEEMFEEVIRGAREEINLIVSDLTELFKKHKINYYVPPVAQRDEESLVAPFSFKFAAVNAGVGWIGKNGVLITKEYGPRVRLSCILVNYDLPVGTPITKSMCDDGCFICVKACPHKALKGVQWDIGKLREELIDYHLCNSKRSLYLKKHGRKNACGLCMAACPLAEALYGESRCV